MTLSDDNIISENRLDKIKFEILQLEDENAKTKAFSNSEMVEKIKQIIVTGVEERIGE